MTWVSRILAAVAVGLGFGSLAGVIDAETRGKLEALTHEELVADIESEMLSPAGNYAVGIASMLMLVAAVELLAWPVRAAGRAVAGGRRDEAEWDEAMAD